MSTFFSNYSRHSSGILSIYFEVFLIQKYIQLYSAEILNNIGLSKDNPQSTLKFINYCMNSKNQRKGF